MQEQSQPPIPRGHCQSRHDKFPHARIAHSGPPITASAPREKNGAASSFQSPCKSVRNPFFNPARARRHRRENRPNVWNNASYIGFSGESPNLYAAYLQIPTFRFLARPKAFYAFFALGSNEPVSETVRTARGKPHAQARKPGRPTPKILPLLPGTRPPQFPQDRRSMLKAARPDGLHAVHF